MHDPVWTDELLQSPHEASDKAGRVRRMFNAIAPRYELVNSLFSAGRDAHWRRKAVRLSAIRPDDRILDVACGTGDFARAFAAARPALVIGVDFAHEMLVRAAQAGPRATSHAPHGWVEGDALRLPFEDASFTVASCAFGVRNLADLSGGLGEMHRVLRPGGRIVILEFTRPANPRIRRLYEWYSTRLMPTAATWISRDRSGAYRYLPRSVVSFPGVEQMCECLRQGGFETPTVVPLTFGVVTVYIARRN